MKIFWHRSRLTRRCLGGLMANADNVVFAKEHPVPTPHLWLNFWYSYIFKGLFLGQYIGIALARNPWKN